MNKSFIMKLNKMRNWGLPFGMVALMVMTIIACTKYDDPVPVYEEYDGDQDARMQRKVLIVSIDGAVGLEVEKVMPENISELLKTSKYTWNGLSESETNDASTWTSMITGVSVTKHMILDESFRAAPDPADPHSIPDFYPSVFYRIMESKPEYKTAVITPWNELANILMVEADTRIVSVNDEEVKEAAVEQLTDENQEVVIVNFRSVLEAGKASGFSIDNPDYLNAINTTDGYLGEIMSALRSRKNYDQEEWLVIVTSNHGGTESSYGGASLEERNVFTIFHYEDFTSTELKGEYFNTVRLHGTAESGVRAIAQDPNGLYNPGDGSMTIEAKVKINKNAEGNYQYNYPPFLSKAARRTGTDAGWSFFRAGDNINFFVTDNPTAVEIPARVGDDGLWHSIVGVIEKVADGFAIRYYVDGSLVGEKKLETTKSIVSANNELVMGQWNDPWRELDIDMSMADVRIWNTALSFEQIRENSCLPEITAQHPNIDNLIGNWPAQDGGRFFENSISGNPNFELTGDYKYGISSVSLPCDADPSAILVQNVDIASQLYYWLNIETEFDWGLDVSPFLSQYEIEFVK